MAHIAIVNQFFPPYGLTQMNAQIAQRYCRGLLAQGVRVSIICGRYPPLCGIAAPEHVFPAFIPKPTLSSNWAHERREAAHEALLVQRLLDRLEPDAVWFLNTWSLRPTSLCRLANSSRRNLFRFGDEACRLHLLRVGGAETLLSTRIDNLVCNSMSLLERTLGVIGQRNGTATCVMRTPIEPHFFCYSASPVRPTTEVRLLFAGRLVPHKRVELAILATIALQRRKTNRRVKLLIAGAGHDATYIQVLHEIASDTGMANQIDFAGFLPAAQLAHAMRSSNVLLFTSGARPSSRTIEGTPSVICEAFAVGLPVVAGQAEGITEIVQHEMTGWIVPSDDPEEWATVLDSVIGGDRVAAVRSAARLWSNAYCQLEAQIQALSRLTTV